MCKGAELVEHPVFITNDNLLAAVRALAFVEQDKARRSVDYRNLGSEELGSVYESLLELHPDVNIPGRTFELNIAAGHERKTTGSYYTPDSLVQCLLDSGLEPVVADRIKGKKANEAAKAILDLRVCDPACGSGHFLIAAAHRLARHLARIRSGEAEPSPADYQHALRDVIAHCVYGVDINPMAVELCKVSLWMEALEPGKPLSFLDHHIQCGNSLLGATPALLRQGIPDEAFERIEGDNRKLCKEYKKQNRDEHHGQKTIFAEGGKPWERMGDFAVTMATFDTTDDDSLDSVRNKEERYAQLVSSADYLSGRFWADTWCAAFVWKKTKEFDYAITEDVFRRIERNPHDCAPWMRAEIQRLAQQYQLLHWHLAFPQVFCVAANRVHAENKQAGWSGGFDVVLGNPPWERVKLQEQEFFAVRNEDIARAANAAARKRLIAALPTTDPMLWSEWSEASREAAGQSQFVRRSGRYPLCGKGDVNTYTLFAEHNRLILGPEGRAGFIVPTGIATDDTTKEYFCNLVASGNLRSLYDFQTGPATFGNLAHGAFRFSLLTISAQDLGVPSDLSFFASAPDDLQDSARHFSLSPADFVTLSPNTRTCPTFRSRSDAELNLAIYRRVGVLWREDDTDANPWRLRFMRMFDMANDSELFRIRAEINASCDQSAADVSPTASGQFLPLYEAKMVDHFDHRYASLVGVDASGGRISRKLTGWYSAIGEDPFETAQPQYWVSAAEVDQRLGGRWDRGWLLGWRDICRSTDQRTVIASLIPRVAVGDKFLLMMPSADPADVAALYANMCSFHLDYCARQKVSGTSLKYFTMRQLPLLSPATYGAEAPWCIGMTLRGWILMRVLELTYTAWDMEPFAHDCAWHGPPFRWDNDRRFLLRCELDAAFFHLYLPAGANGCWQLTENETADNLARLTASFPTPRDAVAYIMDTFPILRRKDERKYDGDYRTKRVLLEIYDAMAHAIQTGQPYQTRLAPPPADSRVAHPPPQRGTGATHEAP